jgi:hypothetical protein
MRFPFFVLMLGTQLAFGQASPSPDPLSQLTSPWTTQPRDFSKLPPQWGTLRGMPYARIYRPVPKPAIPLGDARIDPQILVHPPQSGIVSQPPGTAIAQNQFPGLQYLPIEWPQAKIKPIPTRLPYLKIHEDAANPPGNSILGSAP